MVRLFRPEELKGVISYEDAIKAVEEAFREWGKNPVLNNPRQRTHTPDGVRVSIHHGAAPFLGMTGYMSHCELLKQFPEHQKSVFHGHPVTVLYDASTAELRGILVGNPTSQELPISHAATELRTAATSAVGTAALARKDAKTLGLFGAGNQARAHLVALSKLYDFEKIKVYTRSRENREGLAREMTKRFSLPVEPVDEPRKAATGVDIILTATNASIAVFDGRWLEEGVHITSIVSSNVGLMKGGFIRKKRRELDDETIRRAGVIVVCSKPQAIQDEQGDLFDPVQAGITSWEKIQELAALLNRDIPGRTSDREITLFKNNAGQGVADVALGALAYKILVERDRGQELGISGGEA
ncbi:MAG: ornithine cyclodeaminase family protein [Deltaproteobacteria bacterium]|nr:ornithine cyclodeaminase family protein [Deltaproteobacteria bacterium]